MTPEQSDPVLRISSLTNLGESISELEQSHDHWELEIIDTHDNAKVVANTKEEIKDRNLRQYSDYVCRLESDHHGMLTLSFHEKLLEERIWVDPIGTRGIGVGNQQCPDPRTLGSTLKDVVGGIESHREIIGYDISKINAGSIANGGHLTSYEVTYDLILD